MNLSEEQKKAIENGRPVRVVINRTSCVIIRQDIYEQVEASLPPEQFYPAVLEALADENPEQYLEYLDEK